MNARIISIKPIAVSTLAVVVFLLVSAQAQAPARKLTGHLFSNRSEFRFQAKQRLPVRPAGFALMPETSFTSIMPTAAANLPVFGSGTLGRLTKWTGFTSSNSAIGDSSIFEDKFGKVGIGTDSPTSKLTVAGMIETTLGGLKFPDGTVQTTAGLASTFHDSTLTGNGTSGSPLAVAIPLTLSGSSPTTPILTVTNTGAGLGLHGVSGASGKSGVLGTSTAPGGVGVSGETATNIGVFGSAESGIGVSALSISGTALKALAASGGDAVVADAGPSNSAFGGDGVVANGGDNTGSGQGGHGVVATGGDNPSLGHGGAGVIAVGGTGSGSGKSGGVGVNAFGGSGVNGATEGFAGNFGGHVSVSGNLSKGGGSFKIDHPLAPENKYLYHSFVESPDMKNIYDGVIRLDANGEAIVSMPEWFGALNRDFRYLLTAIGAPMPGLYVAEELHDNSFRIAGGQPGMKVSWQVTGIRQDAYANKNRINVEEDKPERERGFYLHPEVFNQPEERGVEWARNPEVMQQLKLRREKAQQHVHKQER